MGVRYLSVSEMGLRYPEFLEPNIEEIKSDRKKWAQYQAYVTHLLFAYDELFTVLDAPEWDATFKQDVSDHIEYFCNHMDIKEAMMQYFPKLKAKLRAVVLQRPDSSCPNRHAWLSLG